MIGKLVSSRVVAVAIVGAKHRQMGPAHPYSMGLLQGIPTLEQRNQERLASIEGMPPDLRV